MQAVVPDVKEKAGVDLVFDELAGVAPKLNKPVPVGFSDIVVVVFFSLSQLSAVADGSLAFVSTMCHNDMGIPTT